MAGFLEVGTFVRYHEERQIARLEERIAELEKGRCGVKNLPADWYERVRWQVMPDGSVKAEPFWMWCDRCDLYHYFPNEQKAPDEAAPDPFIDVGMSEGRPQ